MHVVDIEIQIHRSERSVGTQGQGVTAHLGVRQDIAVAHVGIRETQTCLAGIHRDDGRVVGGQTELKEISRVVRYNQEGVLLTIEITEHQASVSFRAPGLIGVAHSIHVILSFGTHTIDLLYVVPFAQLAVEGERSVVLYAPLGITRSGFLGRDEYHTMAGTAAIECSSCRTFQDRHRLDVIGVDCRDTVTEVVTAFCAGGTEIGVVHRHSVDDVERLVVAGHFGSTSQNDSCRTRRSACRLRNHQTRHTSGERVSYVDLFGFGEFFAFDFAYFVTQRFPVTLDTHCRHHHLGEHLRVFGHSNANGVATGHCNRLRGVAHVGKLEFVAYVGFDGESTVKIGNRTPGCTLHEHTCANEWTIGVLNSTRDDVLRECQTRSSHQENYKAKQIPETCFHSICHYEINIR